MRRRSGFTLIELLIVVALIGFLAAVAVPNFTCGNHGGSNVRACYANQKTVGGALEMWRLDNGQPAARLDEAMARRLLKEGYLQCYPADPGHGEDFTLIEVGPIESSAFVCLNHGTIASLEDFGDTAREHLVKLGVTDPALLGRASTESIAGQANRGLCRLKRSTWQPLLVGGLLTLGVFTSFTAVVWTTSAVLHALSRDFPMSAPVVPRPVVPRRRPARRGRPVAPILEAETIVFLAEEARCPVCASGYEGRLAAAHVCEDCGTLQHMDCFEYTGRCAIFGCDP